MILLIGFHIVVGRSFNNAILLPRDVNKVFLGNSTFEYGIDDSKIPGSINFAQNAEPIDIMYAKLKLLVQFNPQIDSAFIELDDIVLYNNELEPTVSNAIYLNAFDAEDWCTNLTQRRFNRFTAYFSHAYDVIKIRLILTSKEIRELGIGCYADLHRDKLSESIKRYKKATGRRSIPPANLYYYKKIVEFCRTNGITPIFLNIPNYKLTWDENQYRDFHEKYFKDVNLIDCRQIQLPDSCYGDLYHINYRGASIFTDSLYRLIYQ